MLYSNCCKKNCIFLATLIAINAGPPLYSVAVSSCIFLTITPGVATITSFKMCIFDNGIREDSDIKRSFWGGRVS